MLYHPMMRGLNGEDRVSVARERESSARSVLLDSARDRPAVHRTLVPVDGSHAARRAVEHVDSLAQRGLTSDVHLLNVQPLVMRGDFAFEDIVQAELRGRRAAAQRILDRAQALLRTRGIACHAAVRFGDIAETIVRYASEQGIDAIVLGTRAKRSLSNWLRRSIALKVVRRADVPVTVLKPVDTSAARTLLDSAALSAFVSRTR
jgi:nucleotide-binding universal stress UspA family protein